MKMKLTKLRLALGMKITSPLLIYQLIKYKRKQKRKVKDLEAEMAPERERPRRLAAMLSDIPSMVPINLCCMICVLGLQELSCMPA